MIDHIIDDFLRAEGGCVEKCFYGLWNLIKSMIEVAIKDTGSLIGTI